MIQKRKSYTLTVLTDPGHGWFKIKRSHLRDLDIEDKISVLSYQRGDFVYLEEDDDAGVYLDALEQFCGHRNFKVIERNAAVRYSRVRTYDYYTP